MKDTHGRYASYWNASHARSGHTWQGRFYSCPLDPMHLWEALGYPELNPVRAGMVAQPEMWPWSSAAAHCGAAQPEKLLEYGTVAAALDAGATENVPRCRRKRLAARGDSPLHSHRPSFWQRRIRRHAPRRRTLTAGSPLARAPERWPQESVGGQWHTINY